MKVIITGESDINDNPPSIREIGEVLEELKGIGLCKNIKDTADFMRNCFYRGFNEYQKDMISYD
tara:strand:- start:693 stop:884 length:192 start_codon:yes stop_codon:yes gene_type:complete